jgi:hypothetical protein
MTERGLLMWVCSLTIKKKKYSDQHNMLARKRKALKGNRGQPRQVMRAQPFIGEG